ncbi:MAG: threonine/serine dehydratase [Deinococcales bacterium]
MPISLEHIQNALQHIDPLFLNSPQYEIDSLNETLGFKLLLKNECLNPIRSFKGRGSDYLLSQLKADQGPLVCASAGNFGQGMAYAARKRGVELIVFVSKHANPLKCQKMRGFGATLRIEGDDFDGAKAAAKGYALENGLKFIEDGKEPDITIGAGTMALEMLKDAPLDVALIPLGNGALLNGVATVFKALSPATKVIGICAEAAPAMALSWQKKAVISTETAETLADGIAVRLPVPEALEMMEGLVDEVWLVSEGDIVEGMKVGFGEVGVGLEPAGAVGLATAIRYQNQLKNQHVVTILCGSNLSEAHYHLLSPNL